MPLSLDVVLLAFQRGSLHVFTHVEHDGRARRTLPWLTYTGSDPLDTAARQAARTAAGGAAAWLTQIGVFDGRKRHPAPAELSIAYLALAGCAPAATTGESSEWMECTAASALAPRQRAMVETALTLLRLRIDFDPIAFHLLPSTFTLSQLQDVYEEILGHSLHKASFRRSLQSASLVQPLEEYRTDGRGRPAQLFRYAPSPHRVLPRSARFDLLASD
jgi:8-oxo-dGTP diphosphatase